MKSLKVTAMLVMAVLPLAGCGSGGDNQANSPLSSPLGQEIVISTDGDPSPQNVGILMAEERGYFEEAGLWIWFRPPVAPTRTIRYLLTSDEIDLAISHAPQVVLSREKGLSVTAIGSLVGQPTAAMIWLAKSHIENIADLKGKTIATPGLPFQKALLESFLRQGGLTLDDVKLRFGGYSLIPMLLKGQVDAIFGGSWNMEGIQLKARGAKPVITRLDVPVYDELVLVGRPRYLSNHSILVRKFLSAVARGTRAAIEDPEAAARLLVGTAADRRLKTTEAEVKATVPLLSESGEMSPDRWSELAGWMHDQGLIEGEPSAADLLTDEYLSSEP